VYGTLMRGRRHHDQMVGASFEGKTTTAPGYTLYRVGEYPAMVQRGAGIVQGELYAVDAALLARLDQFEGSSYARVRITLSDGRRPFAYLQPVPAKQAERLESGVWLE
jgi:gamma-glutamylaminecyclotransferase